MLKPFWKRNNENKIEKAVDKLSHMLYYASERSEKDNEFINEYKKLIDAVEEITDQAEN